MRINVISSAWWGPPRKFDRPETDRRVSWLELFYDLVYVIAISRITHQLSLHISADGFFEFAVLFILVYWGWLNGSLYHDLHGSEGLRTRLMTLWQMMIIAALAVLIGQGQNKSYHQIIVVFMIMQIYITYMWWSVGFYDRSHRRYNMPYTILYLISLALMGFSLAVPESWMKLILPLVIIFNYAPPFVTQSLLRRSATDLDLSTSMFERLGLFTIIIFGELVLGVVNGAGHAQVIDTEAWLNFALAIAIVFELWWIFFTMVARREPKRGFILASLLELLFIPTLISLASIAVGFTTFLGSQYDIFLQKVVGYSVMTFLICIMLIMGLLVIPERFVPVKQPIRNSILLTASVFLISALIGTHIEKVYYLTGVTIILILEILYLNSLYYRKVAGKEKQ